MKQGHLFDKDYDPDYSYRIESLSYICESANLTVRNIINSMRQIGASRDNSYISRFILGEITNLESRINTIHSDLDIASSTSSNLSKGQKNMLNRLRLAYIDLSIALNTFLNRVRKYEYEALVTESVRDWFKKNGKFADDLNNANFQVQKLTKEIREVFFA